MTDTSNTRPRPEQPARSSARVLFAALDDDVTRRIVLGIGPTTEAARADAAQWLGEANASAERLATFEIVPITEAEAAVVRAGDRTWPIEVGAAKVLLT